MKAVRLIWWLLPACALLSCGRKGPMEPGVHSLTGHVRLTGYLVDGNGRFAGTRVVEDADGVLVELVFGTRVVARTTTVDGNYRFMRVRPGGYIARSPVIGEIGDVTEALTVSSYDVVVDDTLDVKAKGDIYPVPNPGVPPISVYFELADSGRIQVEFLTLSGTVVRHAEIDLTSGLQFVLWPGYDQSGNPATDPIYWVTVKTTTDERAHLLFR